MCAVQHRYRAPAGDTEQVAVGDDRRGVLVDAEPEQGRRLRDEHRQPAVPVALVEVLVDDAGPDQAQAGAVVAGTSAGASAMSSHMIAFGASGATPKHRMAQIAAGLGVLPGVIIDQHFQQRNRLGRLLSLIAQNPSLLGLGVDEDTAGVVGPDHIMEVIGRGSITVVDGAKSETDAWEIHGHRPLMISGVVLHSLPAGYRFDLRRRERVATPTLHALPGGEAASS